MMAGRQSFGALVRREREAKEIGLREMAKKIGVSPTYLSKIERGEFDPPAEDKVRKIAEIIGRDPDEVVGHIERGRMLVMLNRNEYWQCAFVIPKGGSQAVERAGLDEFRDGIGGLAPFLRDRLAEIDSWDRVKLLTVAVDRLKRWYRPGLLCIGDAAHAMSPIGGVGINLAVQDAVAAANILAEPLLRRSVTLDTLRAVQRRREFPTRATQGLQLVMQNNLIGPALAGTATRPKAPLFVKLMQWPLLNRLPGRFLALGVRPEHVTTPAVVHSDENGG